MSVISFSRTEQRRAGLLPEIQPRVRRTYARRSQKINSDEVDKIYWSIREVAAMLSVARSAIRFWDEEFGLNIPKNRKGDRKFTANDVDKVKRIHHLLKVEGYTIEGAKRQLRNG